MMNYARAQGSHTYFNWILKKCLSEPRKTDFFSFLYMLGSF